MPDFPRLAARRGETHAEAVILARNLANTPANSLTPEDMAEEARKLARRHDMNCEVLEREDIVSLGMGAFAAVAAGSANDPRLIILEHAPAGHADEAPLIVVGKGITFDTGGYDIKDDESMSTMKSDMGGAAAVIGAVLAIARAGIKANVTAVVAACENRVSGNAYLPGDVLRTMSGKTVEVINTDAEGRLTLIDAVTYAVQKENAFAVIDIATLTGGRAAEEVVFHSITTGASNDIEQATKLARAMLTRYGMSDEFDMVALETVNNQYLGGDTSLACSAQTQCEIDQKVVELVKAQHAKAVQILTDNRAKLDELAQYLYQKETITGDEFMEILNREG